jgi:hypothetical protein
MTEDELTLYLGKRVLEDADKLRLFMPDCYARFPLEWCGYDYEVQVILKGKTDDVPN